MVVVALGLLSGAASARDVARNDDDQGGYSQGTEERGGARHERRERERAREERRERDQDGPRDRGRDRRGDATHANDDGGSSDQADDSSGDDDRRGRGRGRGRNRDGGGGDYAPMESILRDIRGRYPGHQLDVSGPDGGDRYGIKWLTEDNRVLYITVDAETGRIISVQGDE